MNLLRKNKRLYTKNMVPKQKVYGEKLIEFKGDEYREWNPTRSKLAAAMLNGLKTDIEKGMKILYLGASAGTTVSHISDLIEQEGLIYAVEFSERMVRELLPVTEKRKNIMPILADARKPETYFWVEESDLVYVDVAQPDETELAIRNCKTFLKKNGLLMIAIKSQSIDVTKKPDQVYNQEKEKLKKNGFKIINLIKLEPYQKDHCFIVAQLV